MPPNFTELSPERRSPGRGDYLRVAKNGLSFSKRAYNRMGQPLTVYVKVSEDKAMLKVGPGGKFPVIVSKQTTKDSRARANGRIIGKTATHGSYKYYQEDLYTLE